MSAFPVLQTGAVLQFPAEKTYSYSTDIVRFVDGSEQRFRNYPSSLKRWAVRLDMLTETELNGLREFFRIQNGAGGVFEFTDPWDGSQYPSCSLETEVMTETLHDEGRSRTTVVIRENKS